MEVEAKLLERNESHFGQADGPFTRGNLDNIPFTASGKLADKILTGDAHHLKEVLQQFLETMKRPANTPDIPNTITAEEVRGKFDNWKESTPTSPTTKQHLHHYHCLLRLMDQEKSNKEPDESITQAKAIFHAHVSILEHTVKHGRSLK
jgi:hypothetical protein